MTPHIEAKPGDYADTVLLPGDPLRAKWIAETFFDNKHYDIAIKAYDYVLSKGKSNFLFIDATINRLYALVKISKGKDLNNIDKQYKNAISLLGKDKSTILLLSNYVYLKILKLHKLEVQHYQQ